jgi:hypothetical protein
MYGGGGGGYGAPRVEVCFSHLSRLSPLPTSTYAFCYCYLPYFGLTSTRHCLASVPRAVLWCAVLSRLSARRLPSHLLSLRARHCRRRRRISSYVLLLCVYCVLCVFSISLSLSLSLMCMCVFRHWSLAWSTPAFALALSIASSS